MIWRHLVGLTVPLLVMGILIFCGLGTAALAEELNIANGDIHITETGYRQGQSQQIAYTGPYTVTGTGSGAIVVESGAHDITISNLQITASGTPAIQVDAGAALRLTVEGENIGGNGEDQRGGDSVDFGLVCVTENFTGILDATGGAASVYKDGENAFGGGAGIGSGGFNMGLIDNYTKPGLYYWGEVVGRIELHGGTIRAHSAGNGAGIGGGGGQGEDTASSQITILISGGSITAQGGTLGAGIGGGAICDGGRIRISGGSISATAGPCEDSMGAAGIGGGNDSSVQEISITGGTVVARASGGAAGIGGGTNTSYSPVHYGDVDGQVSPDRTGAISISGDGASVYAYGGTGQRSSATYGGAGIGSGYPTANQDRSVAFHISITNGASVRAFGGYHAQAIGYGYRPTDYTGYGITLELDDSIFLWAQNADYYQPALAAATKYNAALHQLFQRQPLSDGLYGRRQKCLRTRQPSGARLPGPAVRRSRRDV